MTIDERIDDLASRQHGVVNRKQLFELGVGENAIRHRLAEGGFVAISPAVVRLRGSTRTEMQRASAGILDAPGIAYLSHRSASAFWRLPGFSLAPPIQVVIPWHGTKQRTRLATVHYHRGLPQDHLLETGGIRVVSPALAVFLLAGTEHPGRTERALDNGLAMRLFTNNTMHQLLGQLAARGRNGIRLMRALMAERPPGYVPPQSGLEARVGRLAGEVGVELKRQVDVGATDWIGRVDFEIVGSTDIIEVLSERYHSALLDREADTTRFRRLEGSGRRVLTLWDADVWGNPEAVRQQISSFWRDKPAP